MTQTNGPAIPSREWLERNLRLCLEAEIARGTIRVRFVVIETPSTNDLSHSEEYLRGLHNEAVNDIVAREADHIWNNAAQMAQGRPDMRLRDAAQDAASWLRAFGWNPYGVAVQDDFDDHVPILVALEAALAGERWDTKEASDGR